VGTPALSLVSELKAVLPYLTPGLFSLPSQTYRTHASNRFAMLVFRSAPDGQHSTSLRVSQRPVDDCGPAGRILIR